MTSKERYWAEHLAAIAAEDITTKAYAEREQLSVTALYYWRSRFKHEAGPTDTSSRQLVPIRLASSGRDDTGCTLTLGSGIELKLAELPQPQWLAALAAAAVGSY